MTRHATRRRFLGTTLAGGMLAGLSDWQFLGRLPAVSAAEAAPAGGVVRLTPDIEPLVVLIEETPREKLLEEIAAKIRSGTTYPQVLAALLLAGVRNVQPRPSVGFKFHAVLVVNSAHLASLASPDEHRWLPIFWALDHFKQAQADDVREGNWTMAPVDEQAVPGSADDARRLFTDAMNSWDEAKADAAAAGLARHLKPEESFEWFCRFGCRDFRSIGHKAIFVSNSFRTLETIGWQHAEPVLRSLAYALLAHGDGNPAEQDLPEDRPGRQNLQRLTKLGETWQAGKTDAQATRDLLSTLRGGSPDEACEQVVALLNRDIAPQAVWDALLVGAGELLVRQPGIVGLHAVTSTNALRYAFATSRDDQTKRLLILQNAAFLPMFREAMVGRGRVADVDLTALEPAPLAAAGSPLDEIFADVGSDPMSAARKTLSYVREHPDPEKYLDTARLLVFFKGRDAHDYKFSSALLEDYAHVSPEWRARYLASGVFNLRGSGAADNRLVERTRAALAG